MLVVDTALGRAVMARARAHGLALDELAARLDLPMSDLSAFLSGGRRLGGGLASSLARALGDPPSFWLDLDRGTGGGVATRDPWVEAVQTYRTETLKVLRDRGHVTAKRNQPTRLAAELAEFFGCQPTETPDLVPASFRQSSAHPVARDAVEVWLRLANKQAALVADVESVPGLNPVALRSLLPGLVQVGSAMPNDYLAEVKAQLADVGVAVLFQPDVPGTRLSGASWPTEQGHGVVAMTLRYRTDDFFWWTLFHECAHLLLGHGLVLDSVDAQDHRGAQEGAADELARELLLPERWDGELTKVSGARVQSLAERLGVPAGVLVGQLQHSRGLPPHWLRQLKKPMPKPADLEVSGLPHPTGPEWEAAMAELLRQAPPTS
ncbi:MAG: hypothetical protein JWO98_161 [Frankiales bacterium]|nr:hypothetical protein [Frankiales bacterium]